MKKSKNPSAPKPKANKAKKRKASGTVHEVTIEDLSIAKKHAAANGGVQRCLEALKALQVLSLD